MKSKSVKLYACGTIPWEFDKSNAGPMEFYNSADACHDDRPCSDECGILEFEIVRKRTVRKPTEFGGKGYDVVERETGNACNLARKIEELLERSRHSARVKRSAVTRVLAEFNLESRRARARARKGAAR